MEELTFQIRVDVSVMGGGPPLPGLVRVPGEDGERVGEEAYFELTVPALPSEVDEDPDSQPLPARKRSG